MALFEVIANADRRIVSAVSLQETSQVVFARRGLHGLEQLEDMLQAIRAEIAAHDEGLARLAVEAFKRFGKGIHSQARLNLGDCAAYALSKKIGAPLLFKGNDFTATDVAACLPQIGP